LRHQIELKCKEVLTFLLLAWHKASPWCTFPLLMCAFLFFFISFTFWTVEFFAFILRICSWKFIGWSSGKYFPSARFTSTANHICRDVNSIKLNFFYLNKNFYNYLNILLSCLLKNEILFIVIMCNVNILTPIYLQFYRART